MDTSQQNLKNQIKYEIMRELSSPQLLSNNLAQTVSFHTHNGIDSPLINPIYLIGGGVAGNNKDVQYNNAGKMGGDDGLMWDKTNKQLILKG